MEPTSITKVSGGNELKFICPHCNKILKKEELGIFQMVFKWTCEKHGWIYGFSLATLFETEKSKYLRLHTNYK